MEAKAILQANVLDIIFENRNKNYGAYTLRKHYNERLLRALGATFLITAGFFIIHPTKNKPVKMLNTLPGIIFKQVIMDAPKLPTAKQPEKPKAASVAPLVNTQQYTNNIKIVNDDLKATKLAENLDSVAIGIDTITGAKPGTATIVKGTGDIGNTGTAKHEGNMIDKETPINTADVMPSYPGGTDALRKFLQKNLHNPEDLNEGQAVSVKIKFVVGYDGALKGFETVQDGGEAFNNEVIRVLKKMPAWIPGKTRGQNVSVYYVIPVKFVVQ